MSGHAEFRGCLWLIVSRKAFTSGEFNEMEKSLIQGRRLHDFPANQPANQIF